MVISGIGQGTGPLSLRERDSFTSFRATQIAATRAYQMAGVTHKEIDFAEVHDAFTPFEIISTEDLGFFPPGKGGQAAEAGKTSLEGPLPINPSGGLKSRGHPIGASGVAQIVEVAERLRGKSEAKTRRKAERGLAQSTGGLGTNNFVTILEHAGHSPKSQGSWIPPSPTQIHRPPRQQNSPPTPSVDEGRIETFTILYITPDGFLPPLALALIRDLRGRLLLARGEDIAHLNIGREVYLREVGDSYLFTVKSHLRTVSEAIKKLFRRLHPLPRKGKEAPRKNEAL